MKHDCMKFIDKAVRKGRANYACVKCKKDVSLMWLIYMQGVVTTPHDTGWSERFDKQFPYSVGMAFEEMDIEALKSFIEREKQLSFEEGAAQATAKIRKIVEGMRDEPAWKDWSTVFDAILSAISPENRYLA